LYSSLMSLSTLYCLFFPLYSSASHPDHPSFPTRRSSDLRSRTGRATTRGRSWVSSSLLRVQPHLPHDLDDLGLGLRKHVHQGNGSADGVRHTVAYDRRGALHQRRPGPVEVLPLCHRHDDLFVVGLPGEELRRLLTRLVDVV